ncbi:MAG: hypothetical protein ACM3YO_03835 [Bacteroidota bacterium]
MTVAKAQEWAKGVRALAMLLAVLIWLSVVLERPGEMRLTVSVYLDHVPQGLWVASPPPQEVDVVVSGPRILLLLLPLRVTGCTLDLTGVGPGAVSVTPRDSSFDLNGELKVVQVIPSSVPLVMAKTAKK